MFFFILTKYKINNIDPKPNISHNVHKKNHPINEYTINYKINFSFVDNFLYIIIYKLSSIKFTPNYLT